MTNKPSFKPIQQQGFTLIELMISIVLGLLVIAAAMAIFLSGQRSLNMQTGMSELQQNSIFGLSQIAHDLRHLNLNTTQDQKITLTNLGSGVVFATVNNASVQNDFLTAQGVTKTNMNVGSDRLTIQFKPSAGSNLVNCEGTPLNNPALVNVQSYYIQAVPNTNPARYNLMCDASYNGSALGQNAVVLVQDVEAFRVRYVVRNVNTKTISYKFLSTNPRLAADDTVIGVEIGLVARSSSSVGGGNKIPVPKDKSSAFNIAGIDVWLSNSAGQDRFLRQSFSQVIAIRNGQGGI